MSHPPAWWPWPLLALVLGFFAYIRSGMLAFPLERDEGEYAYSAQLILQGILPYLHCYTMKLPGTALMYAFFMAIFGQSATGIHLGLLVTNAATTLLIYFLAALFSGRLAGVVAAASYALLSVGPAFPGFAAHATHFVVLMAVAGILLLLKAIASQRQLLFFLSGALLGLAFLMKQPGILFSGFAFFYLLFRKQPQPRDRRKLGQQAGVMLCGVLLPLAFTCVAVWSGGAFQRFWFWTVSYAGEYEAIVPFQTGMALLASHLESIIKPALYLWLIAAAGLGMVFVYPRARPHAVFLIGFLLFSFLAVCPGLYFRWHYFVLLLPATALLCGIAVSASTAMLAARSRVLATLPAVIFLTAFVCSIAGQWSYFDNRQPAALAYYKANPFIEAVAISDFIRRNTAPGDSIAVLGSEPEIYFYTHRRSATGYVYMYPFSEPQPYASTMQREMIAEVEAARPAVLVLVRTPTSWMFRPGSASIISSWVNAYLRKGYRLAGAVDMLKEGTEYHWDDAQSYQLRSPNSMLVFKRIM